MVKKYPNMCGKSKKITKPCRERSLLLNSIVKLGMGSRENTREND